MKIVIKIRPKIVSIIALIIIAAVVSFFLVVIFTSKPIWLQQFLGEPMMESPFAPCDLDRDGDCDETDGLIFANAFGKCLGEPGYNFNADIDGDGCVVTNDEQIFSETK